MALDIVEATCHNSERSHSLVLLSPLLLVSAALCTRLTRSGAPLNRWIPAMVIQCAVITRLVVSQVEEEMEKDTETEMEGETEGGESGQRSQAPS
ncbi:hypothetical protein J4Q44_G00216730 [Coregonus suidteri]|uniref:Uncharacterized protein n=1 Tax=Coregonus suidteri TaxID=861788 RepID=A0AAN8LAW8_9TELE